MKVVGQQSRHDKAAAARLEGMSWHVSTPRWERCGNGEAWMVGMSRATVRTADGKVGEVEGMLCRAVEPTASW